MKTVFVGTPRFADIALKRLIRNGETPSFVVTVTDKKAGRGQQLSPSPVKETATEKGIRVVEVEDKDTFHNIIKEEKPDIVIIAAFGIIIPQETLDLTTFLNIHPSLLPKYRGPSPIQSTIIDGVENTGVTIIEMDGKIDHGPIVAKSKVKLKEDVTYLEAEELLADEGANLVFSVIQGEIKGEPQDDSEATYTPKISKEDGNIDWKESAEVIERKVRALNPWPGTFTYSDKGKIKILEGGVQEQTSDGPFGEIGKTYLATNNHIAVQTGKDFFIIKKLQLEGKQPVTAKEFLNGNIQFFGCILKSS